MAYTYKDYIDQGNILIDGDNEHRFSMYVPFRIQDNNNQVLIIMRNPSEANELNSDKTINNVLGFCHGKYSGVFVANLFPFYAKDPRQLNQHIGTSDYPKFMNKNKQTIDEILDRNPRIKHVIIAWGANKSKLKGQYKDTIAEVLEIVNKYEKTIFAMRFISSNQPWHPRNWGGEDSGYQLELYEWMTDIL
ncbi:hypothetical protein CXK86_20395 [Paenibacillus sp. BGI2013]|uniref:DUF1643 domain-containing protein n=1 Tax=Paenibacillus sp. BGI2013 TaxID=2058902 RepID=UPI000C6D5FC7|nr:DUF1643 domain-containing protein [Paenibacillus sp. BGI2013]PKQ89409.1 hypothetical protein CXK86_20395 [Paenibacillus sp. BGI2013]